MARSADQSVRRVVVRATAVSRLGSVQDSDGDSLRSVCDRSALPSARGFAGADRAVHRGVEAHSWAQTTQGILREATPHGATYGDRGVAATCTPWFRGH